MYKRLFVITTADVTAPSLDHTPYPGSRTRAVSAVTEPTENETLLLNLLERYLEHGDVQLCPLQADLAGVYTEFQTAHQVQLLPGRVV